MPEIIKNRPSLISALKQSFHKIKPIQNKNTFQVYTFRFQSNFSVISAFLIYGLKWLCISIRVLYFQKFKVLTNLLSLSQQNHIGIMDLLSFYKPLQDNQITQVLEQQRESLNNSLGVTSFQVKKVKRLLTGRLANKNLTFMDTFQNPQNEFDDSENENDQPELNNPIDRFDVATSLNFSLISKTNVHGYQIFLNFYINVKRSTLCFESTIMVNYKIMKIPSKNLMRFIARYFVSYNGRIKQGSFSINPLTKQISFFIQNHSIPDRISSLIRNPQKFLSMFTFQLQQITIRWNQCLQTILYLINRKTYEEINPSRKLKYIKGKLLKMSQMITHSHVDAHFFVENKGIPRFKKINEEERKIKLYHLKNQLNSWEKKIVSIDNAVFPSIRTIIGSKKMLEAKFTFPKWEMPQIKEISQNLACNEYGGKSPIYSEIQILNIQREWPIFQSGFSKIFLIDALYKRQQDPAPTRNRLVKKQTQQKRYKNQIQVLKLLHNEKCLFFPRYYFCQQEQHKQNIIVEYIPESSIDRYLSTKSMFIGYEIKLFLLFQISVALKFLRDNSIVHIDLKPQNILVKIVGDSRQNVHYLIKLIDFGESYCSKVDELSTKIGSRGFTIPYAPPQLLSKGRKFDQKTDVYSFGVIMYEMLFDNFPIQIMKLQKQDFINEHYLKFFSHPYQKLGHYGTQQIMNLLYYVCLKCLKPQPSQRPSLDWLSLILKDFVLIYEQLAK